MRLLSRVANKLRRLISPPRLESATSVPVADWNTKFDALLGARQTHLIYWPAYSNPYQKLFYGAPTPRFSAKPGAIEAALETIAAHPEARVCFHVHWLNALFSGEDMAEKIAQFMAQLRSFHAQGGVVIWTMHNLQEHDRSEGTLETETRAQIADLATAILVHGEAAKQAVAGLLPNAADKLHIIPHGSYIGVYPDTMPPHQARAQLGLASEQTVLLTLGFIRKYKGLTMLCDAVRGLDGVTLAVAGAMQEADRDEIEAVFAQTPEARLYAGWVADEDLQLYLNAADFVVLPYLASLTSGAALLALSFGVPVIAPRLGAFPEVIADGQTGFLYDPDAPGALQQALQRAAGTPAADRAAMRLAAYQTANGHLWAPGRATLFDILAASPSRPGDMLL